MTTYDEQMRARAQALRPKLTPALLSTLVEAVDACAWEADLNEVTIFVNWLHALAEQPAPEYHPLYPE